jgi:hypothetical protein
MYLGALYAFFNKVLLTYQKRWNKEVFGNVEGEEEVIFFNTPCYVLANKLKQLKLGLKPWNKEVFGNVEGDEEVLVGGDSGP